MSQNKVIALVVGGIVAVVAIITAIVVLAGGADTPPPSDTFETAPVTISGDSLPAFVQGADPAVGLQIPSVAGSAFDGTPASIDSTDGRPKALLFLAHWCQHCQAEAPEVQAWVDAGGLPDDVDLIGIATSSSDIRPNFPPSEWLEGVGWSSPIVVDDDNYSTARAFGLEAFPFWVFVDGDGNVVGRVAGRVSMTTLSGLIAELSGG